MTNPVYSSGESVGRLLKTMNMPPLVTNLAIRIDAGHPVSIEVTRFLTEEEIDAISEWYETEGIDCIPVGTTEYNLTRKSNDNDEQDV